ncbi:hypothetical protein NDI56_18050 [Haloarcula sp. S1CR25-12]|uniref:Uncharacterized protein n=1 Tax=Haloarcula saliterrae TaxID=2950534 RepID=A0ABU2FHV1_9EURY|nr:hypothetical protein [Haloarcula sp. S1CR25-12]MDS0261306.1 hypothetical protein [Haloarcula sp. S1CR25-12]
MRTPYRCALRRPYVLRVAAITVQTLAVGPFTIQPEKETTSSTPVDADMRGSQ